MTKRRKKIERTDIRRCSLVQRKTEKASTKNGKERFSGIWTEIKTEREREREREREETERERERERERGDREGET